MRLERPTNICHGGSIHQAGQSHDGDDDPGQGDPRCRVKAAPVQPAAEQRRAQEQRAGGQERDRADHAGDRDGDAPDGPHFSRVRGWRQPGQRECHGHHQRGDHQIADRQRRLAGRSRCSLLSHQTPAKPLPRHPQRELSRDAHQRHTQRNGGREFWRHVGCRRGPVRIPRAKSNTGHRRFSSASAVAAGRDRRPTPATPPANCPGRARSPRCPGRSPRQPASGGPCNHQDAGTIRPSPARQGTIKPGGVNPRLELQNREIGPAARVDRSASRVWRVAASRTNNRFRGIGHSLREWGGHRYEKPSPFIYARGRRKCKRFRPLETARNRKPRSNRRFCLQFTCCGCRWNIHWPRWGIFLPSEVP